MKLKKVLYVVFILTITGGTAWAQPRYDIQDGPNTLNGDTYTGPDYGILGNGSMNANVAVKGSVNAANNTVGLELKGNANATFDDDSNTNSTINLNINNSNVFGIAVDNGSNLTINNINIIVTSSGDNAVRIYSGGEINLTGGSTNLFQVKNNNNTGLQVGYNPGGAALNITGMDVDVSNNGDNGINITDGSKVTMKDMNAININGNTHTGLRIANNDSEITIKGSGSTVVNIKDNNTGNQYAAGLLMENNGKISIADANVEISGNGGLGGIRAFGDNSIKITADSNNGNTLKINGNTSAGVLLNGANATMGVSNMDVEIDGNIKASSNPDSGYGLRIDDYGSKVTFTGSTDGQNTLSVSNNQNTGISLSGNSATRLDIKDMNIVIEGNEGNSEITGHGIEIEDGGKVTITGSGNNYPSVSIKDNHGTGIHVLRGGAIEIEHLDTLLVNNNNYGIDIAYGNSAKINDINIMQFNNNNKQGILANYSGTIEITGNSSGTTTLAASNNGENGIESANSGSLNITGIDIELNGNNFSGLNVNNNATVTITGDGTNTLSLDGNGTYGLMARDGGSADITGMVISGDSLSNKFIAIEGNGRLSFTNSSITTNTDNLFYVVDNNNTQTGTIILDNSSAIGNGARLAYFNAADAILTATDSYLENAIVTATGTDISSTVSLANSEWLMKDSSNITKLTVTGSTIDMRKDSGYNTLTLEGLDSDDTQYLVNTYFDQPGLTTDKIIVGGNGDATGANNILVVTATGTDGCGVINGYGIQVVNLDDAIDKSVNFSLYGDLLEVGAFDYWLYRAADDNYYLQTKRSGSSIAQAVTNMPSVQLSIIGAGTKEMRKRLFELRHHDPLRVNELWIRGYTSSMEVNDAARSKMDVYGVEAGYDREIYNNDDDVVYLGVTAGFMHTENIKHHTSASHNGSATGKAPSVGLYGIWFNNAGWFAYANLRHFWLDMDAKGYTTAGDPVTYNPDRNFFTANLELGKQLECQIENNKRKIIVEPSVELSYAYAGSKSFNTSTGNHIYYGKTESLKTRAALLLGYNYRPLSKAEEEEVTDFEPYVEVGIYKEWKGRTDVNYAGSDFNTSMRGTGYDVTLGVNVKFYDDWYVFGDVTYEKSLSSGHYEGLSGQVGIKYSF